MLGLAAKPIPYCGLPPSPGGLWGRWNLDPVLIAVLALILAFYLIALRRPAARGARRAPWRSWSFVAGWTTLTLALISPLCPLSVSLFAARVGQHMILSLIAAPLLMLGRPGEVFSRFWPEAAARLAERRPLAVLGRPTVAAAAFTVAMWFWHAPGPYDATFASDIVYWSMHITVIGAALMVWRLLLDTPLERAPAALAVGAVSTLQMTFLGALITLTPHLLYAPHILTPYAWGLTQASDQQLGGLIMWVPGCSVFLGATLYALAKMMADRAQPTALA